MYYVAVLHEFPKFKRFPLRGYWQNVVMCFSTLKPTDDSIIGKANEERMKEPTRVAIVSEVKCSTSEQLCFLPDADIHHSMVETNSSQKMEKISSSVGINTKCFLSNKSQSSSSSSSSGGDLQEFNSDDSDVTLNDIESYACFENDRISLCSETGPPKQLKRRRLLPPVKKQKYDYVQSKVKQYVKSNAAH
ncbi:uncharacterized protein LOC126565469 [Anopheles maculipalpis]|uniref:uncharacterized protein LOC126565469 n=1 Tax=Anopheles maculipalpis TaxID=1496333 RepID=UPI0021594910|nr:uncharacterized protein LOC126565469 [Anopheles maculipalpis]